MRVRLIKKKTIEQYSAHHARSKTSFSDWLSKIKIAEWNQPNDIFESFGFADLLGNGSDRAVFNIAGNEYRMICKYWFTDVRVHLYIKCIGTHAEYDKLCKENKQYTVNDY